MFATVATTAMVTRAASRGRAISRLLMAETLGLLVGSGVGGLLYVLSRPTSPFVLEAGCMVMAAIAVTGFGLPEATPSARVALTHHRGILKELGRVPGFVLMCCTNAALTGIQTGVIVFLLPLYLVERGRISPPAVGYLIALGVIGRLPGLWFAGRVSDHQVRMPRLARGLMAFGLVLATIVIVRDPVLLGVWSMLLGATAGFVASLPTTIIGDRVDPPLHGVAIGSLRTATDLGMLLGPLVMGPMADGVDLTVPFLVAGVILWALASACDRHAVRSA
jgi:MFS family permease